MIKRLLIAILVILIGFGLIQLIPYGHDHANPAVIAEPNWDSKTTRSLAKTACFDCHSNESVWPWYSNFAPVSWLVSFDVQEGRRRLNFSEWGSRQQDTREMVELINSGEMPPIQYTLIHANARLDKTQRQNLIQGLINTLK